MVLEIADLSILPGKNAEFELAIAAGVKEVISKAKGFISFKVQKGIENPNRYLLMIEWETLENHMVDFRESPEFAQWRGYVGPFFEKPPAMEHFELLIQ
jgi:heme-degrading monooxygenase HmoA